MRQQARAAAIVMLAAISPPTTATIAEQTLCASHGFLLSYQPTPGMG